jgi:hypothetical protein
MSSWTVYAAYGTGQLIYVIIGSYKIIVYGIWSVSYRYVYKYKYNAYFVMGDEISFPWVGILSVQ